MNLKDANPLHIEGYTLLNHSFISALFALAEKTIRIDKLFLIKNSNSGEKN
jgi:hypothetical protein